MHSDPTAIGTTELTAREKEILKLVATGTSNKEIARQLFISSNTVKVHVRNIFAKIGVTSRTEAAMVAIRMGISQTGTASREDAEKSDDTLLDSGRTATSRKTEIALPNGRQSRKWLWAVLVIMALGLAAGLGVFLFRPSISLSEVRTPAPSPTPLVRWKQLADLPTTRSGLAAAEYENHIFAIGGDNLQGVTDAVESYDPTTNSWQKNSSMPLAVTDINATVIGGKVYVPGGRTASGEVTNILEIYDPRLDHWDKGATLPIALSSYGLVAFEGKLYLFGGWNGKEFVNSVFIYDPDQNTWRTRSPMPTARGFAGAALTGGKIYVLGGYNGKVALAINEEYLPDRDTWSDRTPMPAARYAMGTASLADVLYVIGGVGEKDSNLPFLQYMPQQDQWQASTDVFYQRWSHLGLVPLQTRLYGMGGRWNGVSSNINLSYQAIYTILIPIVP